MTTDVHESLARAAAAGGAHFELRDVETVVDAVTRRVRRGHVLLGVASVAGAAAVVAGVVWGANALAAPGPDAVGPAASPRATVSAEAWTVSDLISVAGPRLKGEAKRLSTPAMLCQHEPLISDARGDADVTSHAIVLADCSAAWLRGSAAYLSSATSSVSTSVTDARASLTYTYALTNEQSWTLPIDTDSIFIWVETHPSADTGELWQGDHALVGPTMWEGAGTVVGMLDSRAEATWVEPGDTLIDSITVTSTDADDALYRAVASGEGFRVTLWGRVHEDAPSSDRAVLVQLGDPAEVPASATN